MIEQNPLDFLDVSPPNGRDFPTRPSGSGRFSDDRFNSQTHLPCDGRSCRSDFGGSSGAVPASFPLYLHMKYWVVLMQSGEECGEKSILTSVVVAVAFRRGWF
jgi:hypothetical protein